MSIRHAAMAVGLEPVCLGSRLLVAKVYRGHAPDSDTLYSSTTSIDLNNLEDPALGVQSPNAVGTPFFSDEFGIELTLESITSGKGSGEGRAVIGVELPLNSQN